MNQLAIQVQHNDSLEKTLQSVKKAGYQYVSLGFGSSKFFHYADWEQEVIRISHLLTENGLECVQTHLPYYDLKISAEIIDEEMDRAMLRCIEASGKLGAAWCAYHPRSAVNDNFSSRKALEYAKVAIEPLVRQAAIHNTGLALENLPVFPDIYYLRFYSSDYEDLCELHDYFHVKEVGICWDFGHAHLMKYDDVQAIRFVGDRIKATHIHNNSGNDDDHLLPTQGSIDWPAVMQEMKPFYQGALTLEIIYPKNRCLDSYMAHSYDCLTYLNDLLH